MHFLLNEAMITRSPTLHTLNAAATRFVGEVNKQKCHSRNLHPLKQLRSSLTIRTKAAHATAITNDALEPAPAAALSRMPTDMFLRSLLISTISSKRLLLLPALSILRFISRPNRGFLFNADKNPVLHAILKKTFYEQFCAGENEAETKMAMKRLKGLGFRGIILTYARETVFDAKTNTGYGQGLDNLNIMAAERQEANARKGEFDSNIGAWTKGTLETVEMLGEGDFLALKLSGAGPHANEAFTAGELPPQQMLDGLDQICTRCKERNIRILIDAESQQFQKGIARVTLDLMRKFNQDGFALVYNTYQAYLKSTPQTLDGHLEAARAEGFVLGLKLVRGAYIATDKRSLIHDNKQDTDNAYNSIAQGALKQQIGRFGGADQNGVPFPRVNLFLASHNKASLIAAHKLREQRVQNGLPTVPIGYGQLQGMSDDVSLSLLRLEGKSPPDVYKCSTWGSMGECLAYLTRRAVENRDAVLRTSDEYNALRKEFRRRLKGVFGFA